MKKNFLLIVLIINLVISINVHALEKTKVKLSKCVDGDTARFILKDEEIKARFLAIDTPESVHPTKEVEPFGKEASEYTCELLENAKTIKIEYDKKSDKVDKYKRHLVWVYVDDELLQAKLISKGYAKVAYLYGDYNYIDELKEEEQKAKEKKIGIWSTDSTESDDYSEIKKLLNNLLNAFKKIIEIFQKLINNML